MKKATASLYDGPKQVMKCALSQRLYEQGPGIQYVFEGKPICKEAALAKGLDLSTVPIPDTIKSKIDLTDYIQGTLNISRRDPHFHKLYAMHAPIYPFKNQ